MATQTVTFAGYTVGYGQETYEQLVPICERYGKKIVVIGGEKALAAAKPYITEAVKGSDLEILGFEWGDRDDDIDYGLLYQNRFAVLKLACSRFDFGNESFIQFCKEKQSWLEGYSFYMALKTFSGGADWLHWKPELRDREKETLEEISKQTEEIFTEKVKGQSVEYVSNDSFEENLLEKRRKRRGKGKHSL